jgi:predicted NACHT family NTPase
VKSVLGGGKGLLLLDGVDEVPNQRRETIRQGLEALIRRYPKNQFVVTTRPEAVPDGWLASSGFSEASINPMSAADRAEFIRRWHAAVSDELVRQGRPESLSSLADELIAKLAESPAIARLATNPLLCAALCALHRDRHRKLPESQSELCEALCQLLLHRRETQAGLHLSEFPREYRDLTYEQKRAIVQAIAHYMVRNDDSVISEGDALAVTRQALRGFPAVRENDAPAVLQALIERSGVLREQRPRIIDFVHNTIKEFLASEIFVAARDVSTLARRALDDAWRQIVLFASATRDRKFATRLVEKIIEFANEETDAALARRLRLAAVSCRYAALHMDPETVQALAAVEKELVPPRNMNDAEALAGSGDNVVPLLRYKRKYNAREAAACIRALRLIGTDAARRALDEYVDDRRLTVAVELAQAVNPLRLAVIQEQLVQNQPLPLVISRQITDLKPLSEIEGVQRLSLKGAPISDCQPLSGIVAN